MNEERKGRKLTSRYVSTLKTTNASGERFYDPEIRGLFLTVYSSGRRSRGLRYGTRARRRWFKLGDYPSVLPEDARKAAQAALAELANGKDPAMDRRAARAGTMTFSTWCDEYIEERRRDLKRPDAVAYYLNKARARWGLRDVADVKPMDVRALFNAHKATPVLANRLRATLSACFNAAVRRKLIPSNPVTEAALVKHRETARSRVLSEEELGRLWLAITEESDEHARAAFRLLLETGARVGEVLAAKWADLDLAGLRWQLRDPKAGKPQVIVLTKETAAWLSRLGPYLVPSANDHRAGRFDLKGPWDRIRMRAGLEEATIHDVRRTYAPCRTCQHPQRKRSTAVWRESRKPRNQSAELLRRTGSTPIASPATIGHTCQRPSPLWPSVMPSCETRPREWTCWPPSDVRPRRPIECSTPATRG